MKKEINWFHPDPNQPRKLIYEDDIKKLAQTIEREGFIHPMEVDPTGKIIVGERRWRAAKNLGWKELEEGKHFRINKDKLTPYQRLMRQVVENVQHVSIAEAEGKSSMNPMDVSRAYKKLLDEGKKRCRPGQQYSESQLAQDIGVGANSVYNALNRLEVSSKVQQAVEEESIAPTFARELGKLPRQKQQEKLLTKIAKYSPTRDKVSEVVKKIKAKPELADDIIETAFEDEEREARSILTKATSLVVLLQKHPKESIENATDSRLIIRELEDLEQHIRDWLAGRPVGETIEGTAQEK